MLSTERLLAISAAFFNNQTAKYFGKCELNSEISLFFRQRLLKA